MRFTEMEGINGNTIYKFNWKTLSERFNDCRIVLDWEDVSIPARKLISEWACHLEMIVDRFDWRAIWKIPLFACNELDVPYPTIVIVRVESVDFQRLKAVVLIIAVQDDNVSLPEQHNVNLIDLWPTKEQFNSATDGEAIAEILDTLRFFYTRLWWPWDDDDYSEDDWFKAHFVNRCQLWEDVESGALRPEEAKFIQTQLSDAQYKREKLVHLSNITHELELQDQIYAEPHSELEEDRNKCLSLNYDLSMMGKEFEFIETPGTRHIYFAKHLDEIYTNDDATTFVVMLPQQLGNHCESLRRVQELIGEDALVDMSSTLQRVVRVYETQGRVFVGPGLFRVRLIFDIGNISICGLHIICNPKVEEQKYTIIAPLHSEHALLQGIGTVILKNLKLDCTYVRAGIVFNRGRLQMENCIMVGNNNSSITEAIQCNEGSEIMLNNCLIESFALAISCGMAASVELTNVRVLDCGFGLVIESAGTRVAINNSCFSKCKNMGIKLDRSVGCKPRNDSELLGKVETIDDAKKYLPNNGADWSGDAVFSECRINIGIYDSRNSLVSDASRRQVLTESNLYT